MCVGVSLGVCVFGCVCVMCVWCVCGVCVMCVYVGVWCVYVCGCVFGFVCVSECDRESSVLKLFWLTSGYSAIDINGNPTVAVLELGKLRKPSNTALVCASVE